jgi:hypothetical protein
MIKISKLEIKRNIGKVGIFVLLFIIFGLLINQTAINNYRNIAKDEFIKNESSKVDSYYTFNQYIAAGFRTMFMPAPISSIFYNSTILKDLQASIDTSFRLDLTSEGRRELGTLDFSWYLPFTVSIFVFFFGFFALQNTERNKDFLKLLLAFSSPKVLYFNIALSRLLLAILSLVIIFFAVYIQFLFNGFLITGLLPFFLVSNLLVIFFFGLGFVLGTLKKIIRGVVIAAVIWLILFLFWPNFLNLKLSDKSKMKAIYENETIKINIITEGERKVIENLNKGKDRIETIREYIENFLNDGKIEKIELDMLDKIKKKARAAQFWSIFNPVTFYQSVNNETSSMGYNGFCEFYKFNIEKKRGFINFYLKKLKSGKVEKYLSGEEYIFYSKPSLPAYFGLGILLQLFYILLLFTFGFFRFKRIMFPLEKKEVFSNIDLKLTKGKHYVYSYDANEPNFPDQVFNVLMGNASNYSGKISVDGENIVTGDKKNFVYLPVPAALPGKMRVKSIVNLLAGIYKIPKPEKEKVKGEFKEIIKEQFDKIKEIEKINLILRMAEYKKADIYLLQNFLVYAKYDTVHGIIDKIKKENTLIIEIDSIHVSFVKFDRYCIIQLDRNSKYEEVKVTED